MSESRYKRMETKWAVVKPLRGRSEDVRPIDKRRRDWETVVKIERDGVVSYGAKLHDTVCVEYFPDGAVTVRCGAWSTYATADFITQFSPFRCWKQHNKLWIEVNGKSIPVTPTGVKMMEEAHGNEYYLAEPIVIHKAVVDRAKAKDAREPLQPFLNFAKTFLALSDGWLMHETCKQVFGWRGDPEHPEQYGYALKHTYINERDLFDKLIREPNDETYLFALCCFAHVGAIQLTHISADRRLAEKFEYEVEFNGVGQNNSRRWKTSNQFHDVHLHFGRLKQRIYKWVHDFSDVHKVVEVSPSERAINGVRFLVNPQ